MIGKIGKLKFSNGTSARVRVVAIDVHSFTPDDYWLEYLEGETNKKLVHPNYGKSPIIKSEILLPKALIMNSDVIEFN